MENPQLQDWRARGRDDLVKRYEQVAAANAKAKKTLLDLLDSAIALVDGAADFPASERARIEDAARAAKGVVASAVFDPQPSAIEAEAAA